MIISQKVIIYSINKKEADHQGGQVHDTLQLSSFSCVMITYPYRNTCGNEQINQNSDFMYKKRNKTLLLLL